MILKKIGPQGHICPNPGALYMYRVDSRARECENPAYFVILARNSDLGAPTIPQSTEKWCILVSFVRIVVLFCTIL